MLAIDFGTTNTVAATAAADGSGAELLRLGNNYRMPSDVMLAEDGQLIVGPQLEQEAELSPDRVLRRPKRQLGDDDVYIAGEWRRPVEPVAAVLRYVYAEARRVHNGETPVLTRLTYPVRWEQVRQDLLREAAHLAGLGEIALLPEPIAAAIGLARREHLADVTSGARVAVYDLGGGTLDTVILERTPQGFRLEGPPGGDEHLGGEDIDDKLAGFLSAQLPGQDRDFLFNPDATSQPQTWRRAAYNYANQVRKAKEALSERHVQRVPLLSPPLSVPYLELTDTDLSAVVGDLVRRSLDRLEANLRLTGTEPKELTAIFLVGGSSRLSTVQRQLGPRFGVPIATYGDPKGLVALGAAELGGDAATPPLEQNRDAGANPATSRVLAPAPTRGSVGRVYTFAAIESPTFSRLSPNCSATVGQWTISPGDRVRLGQVLATVTVRPGNIRAEVRSQYSGVVRALRPREGARFRLGEPLLELHAVTALILQRGRVHPTDTGIAVVIEPAPASLLRQAPSSTILALVAGRKERLWWGESFFLPLPPGIYTIILGHQTANGELQGTVSRLLEISPGERIALSYCAPRTRYATARLIG